ncbi:hypothetical protein C4K22_2485 [Pseudomonas chlororaphis subsp. aurantiaca]|nr:hypothetical protein C4K24_2373 [Pseudomonas chlororaphis subsp. aurantiaca]AZD35228.1 hypothetical protein C4K22_2485 [Pseudomonas chlororaphis subsp. aurantiaca]AZD41562.1 hypothetical protein C4K21_2488 [Pseudomonas chlororaphis subsp. aurantiaca]
MARSGRAAGRDFNQAKSHLAILSDNKNRGRGVDVCVSFSPP